MVNLFVIIILFILLVTQKILLLNEESLILLCFVIFVNLGMNKVGVYLKESFKFQSSEIKVSLTESFKELQMITQNFTMFSSNLKLFFKNVVATKNYYKTLTFSLSDYILICNKYYLTGLYIKKLSFLDKTEEQTTKLLMTTIVKQLNIILKTKYFYTNYIRFNQLLSLTNISVRECIELIKIKKI